MSQALPSPVIHQKPTMYDLPSESPSDPGLPDEFHIYQPQLLIQTCRPVTYLPQQVFMATDMNLYYDLEHLKWYKRPDWFIVVGGSRFYQGRDLRQSYVIWDENISPLLVVELLSEGTEDEDLGRTVRKLGHPPTKWQVYEQILKIPYYVTFDERNSEFRKFRLIGGKYQELPLTERRLWLEELGIGLGVWQGEYQGIEATWLRWYEASGNWIPTTEEDLVEERAKVEQERAKVEQEREKVEILKAQLRALGIEPEF